MRAADVAARQGSYDQAQSICDAILRLEPADERVTAPARALLERIHEARRRPDRPLHVVLMGDSLSMPRPENAKTYDPRLSPELAPVYSETYPVLLRHALESRYAPRDVALSTMCKSSNGMADVAADAYVGLFYFDPNVLIVHCGVVDLWPRDEGALTGPRLDVAAFAAAVGRFLTVRRENCAMKPVVLVGVAPTDQRWIERIPGIDRTIAAYNDILRRTVDERTAFIDMERIVDRADPQATLHADGIHLNRAGHAALAAALADEIAGFGLYGTGGSTNSS